MGSDMDRLVEPNVNRALWHRTRCVRLMVGSRIYLMLSSHRSILAFFLTFRTRPEYQFARLSQVLEK